MYYLVHNPIDSPDIDWKNCNHNKAKIYMYVFCHKHCFTGIEHNKALFIDAYNKSFNFVNILMPQCYLLFLSQRYFLSTYISIDN